MKNNETNRIKKAFDAITPDVLDAVLSDLEEQKGYGIIMTNTKKNHWVKKVSAIAAAVMLLTGAGIFANAYRINNTIASTVALDVNPSVEIKVNAKEKVLSVEALNEDGTIIIGDMNFKGSDIDLTVNALIGSMLKNGYLNELTNSILVSVDNNDPEKSAALRQRIAEEISLILNTDAFSGSVLSQTLSHDASVEEIASANSISTGKAQLIQQISRQNSYYTVEDLASMSINELNLISMSGNLQLENVNAKGSASDKAYIGDEAAKNAALTHAGVKESDIYHFEIELERDHGMMVYDVEFDANGMEYDYDINATTGEVVASDNQREDDWKFYVHDKEGNNITDTVNVDDISATPVISEEKAKSVAYEHAGVAAADVTYAKAEIDRENGILIYEVEFRTATHEYDYHIHVTTAEVLKYEREMELTADGAQKVLENLQKELDNTSVTPSDGTLLTEEQAIAIALQHAAVESTSVKELSAELDQEHGKSVYEVEFTSGGYEYEYEINAVTGDMIKFDKERD